MDTTSNYYYNIIPFSKHENLVINSATDKARYGFMGDSHLATFLFQKPKDELVLKFSLCNKLRDADWWEEQRAYSHIDPIQHVTRTRIDELIQDLREPRHVFPEQNTQELARKMHWEYVMKWLLATWMKSRQANYRSWNYDSWTPASLPLVWHCSSILLILILGVMVLFKSLQRQCMI